MRPFHHSVTLVFLLAAWAGAAQAEINRDLYGPYQWILEQFLTEKTLPGGGLVSAFDYESAVSRQETALTLTNQREALASFDLARLEDEAESVAFWINAYNFFMLDQILTQRPGGELVDSVWDYGGRINPFVDSVFDRQNFTIGGRAYSLNEIEKGILLGDEYEEKGWKDARVHFAVNCASVGCPPLRDVVYTADNIENLLAENTRRAFLTDRHLMVEGDTLRVSELFKWYEDDFSQAAGSSKAFIEDWIEGELAERVAASSNLEFINYDWALNAPANFEEFRSPQARAFGQRAGQLDGSLF